MHDEGPLRRRASERLQMIVEDSMRGALLLGLRSHRKQARGFLDYYDVVVEMHDFQTLALDRCRRDLLARRNSHHIAGFQLGVVLDGSPLRDAYRAEAEEVLGRLA